MGQKAVRWGMSTAGGLLAPASSPYWIHFRREREQRALRGVALVFDGGHPSLGGRMYDSSMVSMAISLAAPPSSPPAPRGGDVGERLGVRQGVVVSDKWCAHRHSVGGERFCRCRWLSLTPSSRRRRGASRDCSPTSSASTSCEGEGHREQEPFGHSDRENRNPRDDILEEVELPHREVRGECVE